MYHIYHENSTTAPGPAKVFKNFVLGLDKLGEEYVLNPSSFDYSADSIFLHKHPYLYFGLNYKLNKTVIPEGINPLNNSLVGPNIAVLPDEEEVLIKQDYKKCIVPAEWIVNLYKKYISEDKLAVWPVGIDTELFNDASKEDKEVDCLIYYKNRGADELSYIISILEKHNQSYAVAMYGYYEEHEFINSIKKSKYCFLLNNTESQGLAVQEIMSSNSPMFVWDVDYWDGKGPDHITPATSVPYWSEICGIKVPAPNAEANLESEFEKFLSEIKNYNPREFILENLTLEKQSAELISLF
jgi:hypothetical protein